MTFPALCATLAAGNTEGVKSMASVGRHIRQLRLARHLTQEQLAERLFVTRQTVSAWETNRAQPDLETLERIAAALGAEVTEVIYGPQSGQDLKTLKRKWMSNGIYLGIFLALAYYILFFCGVWGTWTRGLSYQFGDKAYTVEMEEVPGVWTLELDLRDPDSNDEKMLYEDDTGCTIEVAALDWDPDIESWNLWLLATGACLPWRGTIVSGMMTASDSDIFPRFSTEETASLTVSCGGETWAGTPIGDTLLSRNWKNFGYTLFQGPVDPAELPESVTVSVEGLLRFTTRRTG